MRRWLASTLSAVLVLLSPGLGCYEALARGRAAGAQGAAAAFPPGAAPVSIPALTGEGAALPVLEPMALAVPGALSPVPAAALATDAAAQALALAAPAARALAAETGGALPAAAAPRILPDVSGAALPRTRGEPEAEDEPSPAPGVLPRSFARPSALGENELRAAYDGGTAPGAQDAPVPAAPGAARPSGLSPVTEDASAPAPTPAPPAASGRRQARGFAEFFTQLVGLGALGTATVFLGPFSWQAVVVFLAVVLPSLIFHERGHRAAARLYGDRTVQWKSYFEDWDQEEAALAERGEAPGLFTRMDRAWARWVVSVSPEWARDYVIHVHLWGTLVVPLAATILLGAPLGMARAFWFYSEKFDRGLGRRETLAAKTILAGPLSNLLLAVAAALVYALLALTTAPAFVTMLVLAYVTVNAALFVGNLLPIPTFDGHQLLVWLLKRMGFKKGAERIEKDVMPQYIAAGLAFAFLRPFLFLALKGLVGLLLLPGALLGGGFAIGSARDRAPARPAAVQAPAMPEPVKLLVELKGAPRPLAEDIHLGLIEPGQVALHAASRGRIAAQLEAAGLSASVLAAHGAEPVASYARINTATLRVPAPEAFALRAALESRGFVVHGDEGPEIIYPIEPDPVQLAARGAVTIPQNLRAAGIDKVHAIARKLWGAPGLQRWGLGAGIPQPPVAVIDTGVDLAHPLLKGVKPKNATSGPEKDDNGHGSWVTSMKLLFAPWQKNLTHYKAFQGGGATLDDILKALTWAANDGNIVISNSWGNGRGDPTSLDSKLALKLAEEGRVVVFAAGNSGSGANTIGGPAIMHFRDPITGAPRILAVASTDLAGLVSYYSSRGGGSPTTSRGDKYPGWPRRPDLAGVGQDTEGAWPSYLRPGRVDPVYGPVKAISGTSMITPAIAGGITMLAMLFGVTTVGEKLDKIVLAVMSTLVNPHGQRPEDIGDGFYAFDRAYEAALAAGLTPVAPGMLAGLATRIASFLLGPRGR